LCDREEDIFGGRRKIRGVETALIRMDSSSKRGKKEGLREKGDRNRKKPGNLKRRGVMEETTNKMKSEKEMGGGRETNLYSRGRRKGAAYMSEDTLIILWQILKEEKRERRRLGLFQV